MDSDGKCPFVSGFFHGAHVFISTSFLVVLEHSIEGTHYILFIHSSYLMLNSLHLNLNDHVWPVATVQVVGELAQEEQDRQSRQIGEI